MKANTNRDNRLSFDRVPELYDAGRPAISRAVVEEALRVAGTRRGARVLEIGAGTGQLTRTLVAAGLDVVALEPGDGLRERLAERLAGHVGGDATVRGEFFEDYDVTEAPFAGIWSANAFHWVDPAVSYGKAARMLDPGGSLVLLWTFPIAAAPLQGRLNAEVFSGRFEDFAREPEGYAAWLDGVTRDGREELVASGHFDAPWSRMVVERLDLDVEEYLTMLKSYGHVAELDDDALAPLEEGVRAVVAGAGTGRVVLENHVYACVARRPGPEP